MSVIQDDLDVYVVSYNEQQNIGRCLKHLRWAPRVILVDSFSDDSTLEIARTFDNVVIEQRVFDCLSNQHQHALDLCEARWVLRLDSDWMADPAVFGEIDRLRTGEDVDGYRIPFRFALHGHAVRAALYPPVMCLFRRGAVRYEQDGHTERARCNGTVVDLKTPFLHDDRKPVDRYFSSQLRYSREEAIKLADKLTEDAVPVSGRFFDRMKRQMRRLPGVAPVAVFLYLGVFRGALISGPAGRLYLMQRVFAELAKSIRLLDHALRRGNGKGGSNGF